MSVTSEAVKFIVIRCDLCGEKFRSHEAEQHGDMRSYLEKELPTAQNNLPKGWATPKPDQHVCPSCVDKVNEGLTPPRLRRGAA